MQQAVLDNFKLQLSYGSDNLSTIKLVDKELSYTFVHQLLNTLVKLLGLHRVCILDIFEHFRREAGQSFEMKLFASGQRISDFEIPGIGQSHDIAGVCLIYHLFLLGHESGRTAESHHLSETDMLIVDIAFELTGTDLHECNTTSVVRVHICVNLEYKAGECLFFRINYPFHRLYRPGRWGDLDKAIQQFFHTEVI